MGLSINQWRVKRTNCSPTEMQGHIAQAPAASSPLFGRVNFRQIIVSRAVDYGSSPAHRDAGECRAFPPAGIRRSKADDVGERCGIVSNGGRAI